MSEHAPDPPAEPGPNERTRAQTLLLWAAVAATVLAVGFVLFGLVAGSGR